MSTENKTNNVADPDKGKVYLHITNYGAEVLVYNSCWFNTGQFPNGFAPPQSIAIGESVIIPFVPSPGKSESSGYVNYVTSDLNAPITFAASCPSVGTNKVGLGITSGDGKNNTVWAGMTDYYQEWGQADFSEDADPEAWTGLLQSTPDAVNTAYAILIYPKGN